MQQKFKNQNISKYHNNNNNSFKLKIKLHISAKHFLKT